MKLYQTLEDYYRRLTAMNASENDPRLNTYFLDIHDLALLIQHHLQDAIEQQYLPALIFDIHAIKEHGMAFILITITGGLDDFPVYKKASIKQWQKKGIPQQNGIIESTWYSREFNCLEKIFNLIADKYNYGTNLKSLSAKRYWIMLEIEGKYETCLMQRAVLADDR